MNLRVKMDLRFFEGEKTEKPTSKKKRDARRKGQVALSQEVGTAFLFLASFVALRAFAGGIFRGISEMFHYMFGFISTYEQLPGTESYAGLVSYAFQRVIIMLIPMFAVALIVGIIINLLQVGWHPTTETLKLKFNKLSPKNGIKKMFGMQALMNFVKSLLKIGIIGTVIFLAILEKQEMATVFMRMDIGMSVAYIADFAVTLGIRVGAAYLIIAALDYAYTRYKHNKQLKMSKSEVKDEYKQSEGDPQIKGKIRQKMREVGMRRMMQSIPEADVIITNPTHFAVALKYDISTGAGAPIVTAKGADFLAMRIKDAAKEARVPIVENKPLARTLYDNVDVGREIPPELYVAVVEILLYAYRVANKQVPVA
jgi:flagellar biosynthetic protein FlhB